MHSAAQRSTGSIKSHSRLQCVQQRPLVQPICSGTTNITFRPTSACRQQTLQVQCQAQLHAARISRRPQGFRQSHAAASSPACLQAQQHSFSSGSGPNSSSSSSRSARVRTHVFGKIRDMLSGKGKPQAAAGVKDDDGSDMVRIDAASSGGLGGTTEEVFGPLAVLVVGFKRAELDVFRAMMDELDADVFKVTHNPTRLTTTLVIPCTREMLGGTLLQAFETETPRYEKPPLGQKRALFFSGMYGSELTQVIAAYRDAGLPPCVFAGLVPNNAGRTVADLLEAVWKDQAAMMARQQQESGGVDDSY